MKARKIKEKRSSRKNRKISQQTSLLNRSGRVQFTTTVDDFTYPQHTAVLVKTQKSNLRGHSCSLDSISESGHNECVFHLSSSVQREDQEYKESSSSMSMHQHDEVNSVPSFQETGVGDEYSHGTLQEEPSAPSSSSVTWEEKTEIVGPLQYNVDEVPEILCTDSDIHMQEKAATNFPRVDQTNIVQDDEHKLNSSEMQYTNPELHIEKKAANLQSVVHMDIPNDEVHTLTTVSDKYQSDEVESEPGDFMDALNTIESESESELDCQSISEVSRYSSNVYDKVTKEPTQEHLVLCPNNRPLNVESNLGSPVFADKVTYENVGHSPDYLPANMESNGRPHVFSDRDSPEHLCNDGDVGCIPENLPSDAHSNTSSNILFDRDDQEHVEHNPGHHASSMESSGGSHIPADKDAHKHLYADELAVHSTEHRPSKMATNSEFHSIVDKDGYEHMADSPRHYLSDTKLNSRSYASVEKCTHSPKHYPGNVEPDVISYSCADKGSLSGILNSVPTSHILSYLDISSHKFPNSTAVSFDPLIPVPSSGDYRQLVPFTYSFPNSISSSCDLSNPVSSQSYKEHVPQISEKSLDLVTSYGLESCKRIGIPHGAEGDPAVNDPLYSESIISNSPEPSDDKMAHSICESQATISDINTCQPVAFWTNGGLLGLQPSKPPVFLGINSANQDSLNSSKGERYSSLTKNHMPGVDGYKSSLGTTYENSEILDNCQNITFDEVCSEDQTNGDFSSAVSKSGQFHHNNYANARTNYLDVTSAGVLGTEAALCPDTKSLLNEDNQERDGKSSQSFALGQRLLLSYFNRKVPPAHNDTSELCSSQQNSTYHKALDRTSREPFDCESIQRSPTSSPPLEHMKICFQPVNDSEVSRLKLKIPDGSGCRETGNTFLSFQLVPELTAPLHNLGSESGDDTFCRSSPYISVEDIDLNHLSDSKSEQWESGETLEHEDQELYDALRRMSNVEFTSGFSELVEMVMNRNQVDGGVTNQCSEYDVEHDLSSPLLDLPEFDTKSHIVKHAAKDGSDAEARLQLPLNSTSMPSPLPPSPRQYVSSGTGDNWQHSVSEAFRAFNLEIRGSSIFSQLNRNLHEKKANGEASFLRAKIKEQKVNGHREADKAADGKDMNEREDFLHQIRAKSFSLRPTVTTKSTETPAGSTNVSVTSILDKANAIRQAVGSENGEDDDAWSDS